MTAAESDLFAPALPTREEIERALARADPRQTALFDPDNHPCAVCGAPDAPFGAGWPDAPKFYCRDHKP